MEGTNPGVTPTSPVETTPAAPAAPTAAPSGDTPTPQANPAGQPPASEGVNTPEQQEQQVPYDRFKEVNDRAKESAKRNEELEARLAKLEGANQPQQPDEPQLDPEAQKVLDAYMKKQGFVTQQELQAEKLRIQADNDVQELKREFQDFDESKVLDFAKDNGLLINNKAGLKAAYNMMKSSDPAHNDEVRNQIIAELKESGQLNAQFGEKPGPGGAKLTPGEQPKGMRNILHAAVQKHRTS